MIWKPHPLQSAGQVFATDFRPFPQKAEENKKFNKYEPTTQNHPLFGTFPSLFFGLFFSDISPSDADADDGADAELALPRRCFDALSEIN